MSGELGKVEQKVSKTVKAWAVIDNDGIIDHVNSDMGIFSDRRGADDLAAWGSRRVVPCTITYEVD